MTAREDLARIYVAACGLTDRHRELAQHTQESMHGDSPAGLLRSRLLAMLPAEVVERIMTAAKSPLTMAMARSAVALKERRDREQRDQQRASWATRKPANYDELQRAHDAIACGTAYDEGAA